MGLADLDAAADRQPLAVDTPAALDLRPVLLQAQPVELGREGLEVVMIHERNLAQTARQRSRADRVHLGLAVAREAGVEIAQTVTAKLIELISGFNFPFPGSKKVKLGITAGIAVYPVHARNAGDLLRAADAALYQGKKHSRGTFVVAKMVTGPLSPITVQRPKE